MCGLRHRENGLICEEKQMRKAKIVRKTAETDIRLQLSLDGQGKYKVSIGSGQPGTGVPSVNGNFEVKGQIVLPE